MKIEIKIPNCDPLFGGTDNVEWWASLMQCEYHICHEVASRAIVRVAEVLKLELTDQSNMQLIYNSITMSLKQGSPGEN